MICSPASATLSRVRRSLCTAQLGMCAAKQYLGNPSRLKANGVVAFISMRWDFNEQHQLPYTGSGDGLETWIRANLGSNPWRAEQLYNVVVQSCRGLAADVSNMELRAKW